MLLLFVQLSDIARKDVYIVTFKQKLLLFTVLYFCLVFVLLKRTSGNIISSRDSLCILLALLMNFLMSELFVITTKF